MSNESNSTENEPITIEATEAIDVMMSSIEQGAKRHCERLDDPWARRDRHFREVNFKNSVFLDIF